MTNSQLVSQDRALTPDRNEINNYELRSRKEQVKHCGIENTALGDDPEGNRRSLRHETLNKAKSHKERPKEGEEQENLP